jgi:hypothetical protein
MFVMSELEAERRFIHNHMGDLPPGELDEIVTKLVFGPMQTRAREKRVGHLVGYRSSDVRPRARRTRAPRRARMARRQRRARPTKFSEPPSSTDGPPPPRARDRAHGRRAPFADPPRRT